MLETYTTGFAKAQMEIGRIDVLLGELRKRLKALESPKSLNGMVAKELGKRGQEVERVEQEIRFLLKTKRELKAYLFADEGGQVNLRNNDFIN